MQQIFILDCKGLQMLKLVATQIEKGKVLQKSKFLICSSVTRGLAQQTIFSEARLLLQIQKKLSMKILT